MIFIWVPENARHSLNLVISEKERDSTTIQEIWHLGQCIMALCIRMKRFRNAIKDL